MRLDSYDIAIVGGGPAAWIAGSGLARTGRRVLVLGPHGRPAPQGVHVHVLPPALWPRLFALLPRLESELRERGTPFVPPGAFRLDDPLDDDTPVPAISRFALDDAIRASIRDDPLELRDDRLRGATRDRTGWQIRSLGGDRVRARWLVDATGTARASARAVGDALGAPLPLDEADTVFHYASWRLTGVVLPQARTGHRCWCPASRVGALLAPDGEGVWQITLQLGWRPVDRLPASPWRLLAGLEDEGLMRACAGAAVIDGPHRRAASPVTRIGLDSVAAGGLRWLPLGDALLTTPAVLGWGFEQIAEQCEALAHAAAAGDLAAVVATLETVSRGRFQQAVFAAARRSGLLTAGSTKCSHSQAARSDHVESVA